MKPSILKRVMIITASILVLLMIIEIGRIAGVYLQTGSYRRYWETQNQKPVPEASMVYVALGDSTAQAIGASSPQKGYVGLVAEGLARKYSRNVKIINLSKSGARIDDCLREQLPKLQSYKPDIVTIEIGANDLSNFNETTFRRNIEQLMSQLPKQSAISDMPYFGGGRKRNLEQASVVASRIIHDLATKYNLPIAPLHQTTKDNDNFFVYSADFFHPSNKGYRNWFRAFAEALEL